MDARKAVTAIGVGLLTLAFASATASASGTLILARGSNGPAVTHWQALLNQWAIESGSDRRLALDGIFGPETKAATRAFQRRGHIPAQGVVGPKTRRAWVAGHVTSRPVLVGPGSDDPFVGLWQGALDHWLVRHRLGGSQVLIDGLFGPETEAVTRVFQRATGLTADGVVGTKTWRALSHTPIGLMP